MSLIKRLRDNDTVECNDAATEIERRFSEHRAMAEHLCKTQEFKDSVLSGEVGPNELLRMGIEYRLVDQVAEFKLRGML